MNRAEQEFQNADWQELLPRLTLFTLHWAGLLYGWKADQVLDGRTLEDVPEDVFLAFWNKKRHFADNVPMWVQLKNAVKSVLWNIYQRIKGHKTKLESEIDDPADEECGVIKSVPGGEPTPDAVFESEESAKRFFELLRAHPKVKKNIELQRTVLALENGALGYEELVKATGFAINRLYELVNDLKPIVKSVLKKLKSEEN
jgi:hypothetical protein